MIMVFELTSESASGRFFIRGGIFFVALIFCSNLKLFSIILFLFANNCLIKIIVRRHVQNVFSGNNFDLFHLFQTVVFGAEVEQKNNATKWT